MRNVMLVVLLLIAAVAHADEASFRDAAGMRFVGSPDEVARVERSEAQRQQARVVTEYGYDRAKRLATLAKYAQPVLSRMICAAKSHADEARAELAELRRGVKAAGVKPSRDTREDMIAISMQIMQEEARAKGWAERLKEGWGLAPLPCGCVAAAYACNRAASDCADLMAGIDAVSGAGLPVLIGVEAAPPPDPSIPNETNAWAELCRRDRKPR